MERKDKEKQGDFEPAWTMEKGLALTVEQWDNALTTS